MTTKNIKIGKDCFSRKYKTIYNKITIKLITQHTKTNSKRNIDLYIKDNDINYTIKKS